MTPTDNLLATILCSLVGVHLTYGLIHRTHMNNLRAASLASLLFVGLSSIPHLEFLRPFQPAFFGSTYVAMSEPARLEERYVLLAGLVFGLILFGLQQIDFVHFHGGMGGTLGGTAFVACLVVYLIKPALVGRTARN